MVVIAVIVGIVVGVLMTIRRFDVLRGVRGALLASLGRRGGVVVVVLGLRLVG
jgi:hypothetical protein